MVSCPNIALYVINSALSLLKWLGVRGVIYHVKRISQLWRFLLHRSYFDLPSLSSSTKRKSFWSCKTQQPSSNISDILHAPSWIQGEGNCVCNYDKTTFIYFFCFSKNDPELYQIPQLFVFFLCRKLMNIAFVDMNPFPMRQIQNRRSFHLEKVRLELTELEAIRQTFLRERETSQDRRSFVSDDEEDNWS